MANGIGSGTTEEFFSSEFAALNLCDLRLNQRALKLFNSLQQGLTTCIRRLCLDSKDARQAYDFFSNPKVSGNALMEPHYEETAKRIEASEAEYILAIQDSMVLNYTKHLAKTDIGRVGNSQRDQYGLIQHSTLCVTNNNEPLGLLEIRHFHHDEFDTTGHRHHRPIKEKESYRWLESLEKLRERLGNTSKRLITVADREGDFFEFLHACILQKEEFVIRSCHNRHTGIKHRHRGEKLYDLLEESPELGKSTITIQNVDTREMEEVILKVKALNVTIPPPNKSKKEKELTDYSPININVVQAYSNEHNWILFTSLPISTMEETKKILEIYRSRWHIEDYHKVLKTGYQVDEIYLHSSREAIENLLIMASISACRLYWIIYIGRAEPTIKASQLFKEFEWKSIYVYFGKNIPEKEPPLNEVILQIAQLGGYKPKSNSSPPGVKTLWIGFQKFTIAANMYQQMMSTKT